MANDYFKFKQFTIHQSLCAMKVGTDGTLLACWARGGKHILDIGTGTGLMALIMAQRYPDAEVMAIDIDEDAVSQAKANVKASPFCSRIEVSHADLLSFTTSQLFDAIVCNPPFFINALHCPDKQRTTARHSCSLSYADLMANAKRLLADQGEVSVVVPFDYLKSMDEAAALAGLFKSRECAVQTTPYKSPRRFLLAYQKHSCEELDCSKGIIEISPGVRSDWYSNLTKDFYL